MEILTQWRFILKRQCRLGKFWKIPLHNQLVGKAESWYFYNLIIIFFKKPSIFFSWPWHQYSIIFLYRSSHVLSIIEILLNRFCKSPSLIIAEWRILEPSSPYISSQIRSKPLKYWLILYKSLLSLFSARLPIAKSSDQLTSLDEIQ